MMLIVRKLGSWQPGRLVMKRLLFALLTILVFVSLALAGDSGTIVPKAYQLSENLKSAGTKLADSIAELFTTLEEALKGISRDGQDLDPLYRTITGLRVLVHELHESGVKILRAHDEVIAAGRGYTTELERAPSIIDTLAARYRRYADEEPFSDLKQRYREDAESILGLKAMLVARRATLGPQLKLVEDNRRYVERTVIYLARLEDLLASLPELAEGAKTEQFLAQLKLYVDHFERLKKLLQEFHHKVTAGGQNVTSSVLKINTLAATQPTPKAAEHSVSVRNFAFRPRGSVQTTANR